MTLIKWALKIVILVIAGLLLVVGFGFFINALHLYLQEIFDKPAMASFFCGLSILLFAILLLLLVNLLKSRHVYSKKTQAFNALDLFEKNPVQGSLLAIVTGFVIGFCPKVRDAIVDTVADYISDTDDHSD